MSYATTNYISFLSCFYSVGFLYVNYCSINWFIPEYIISCYCSTGKGLQLLICLVMLLASFYFASLLFLCYYIFFYHFGE